MTAAPVINECENVGEVDEVADWAVSWRLMNFQDPGLRPATAAENRLAVWLLLDCGHDQSDIRDRTGLTKGVVYEVVKQRRAASRPGALAERALAPSRFERMILGVPMGITRPRTCRRRS
ncbi:MAG TPA: hypothetical protein VE155_07160 [Pseudonocardiaceae bacterium]|jgi:hypothetical protein|nr:hypothetical protein [Pseudonocardiaceae bacterium]